MNSTILGLVSYACFGFGSAFRSAGSYVFVVLETHEQAGVRAGIIVGGVRSGMGAAVRGIFDLREIVLALCSVCLLSLLSAC